MFHHFNIGPMAATIVSDGPLRLARPHRVFLGTDQPALADALTKAGQAADRIYVEQNCLVVDTGGKRALFDNGMGTDRTFGPDSGQLLANLRRAGIDPASIDALVLTHAHGDHCWGTMGDDGTPNFPKAVIYMAQQELDFWTADGPIQEKTRGMTAAGRDDASLAGVGKHLLPLRHRIETVRDGQEFLPGIQAWLTPGHTPGHLAFLFTGGWCLTGDVAFHDPLSYAFPESRSAYDAEPELGIETRRRLLGRLADERLSVIGYHHPWPGLGRVERFRDSFRFIAREPGAAG
jgi:glyoxylase-like metal-dependent hydrolase (beta-lactamase superfamily II)